MNSESQPTINHQIAELRHMQLELAMSGRIGESVEVARQIDTVLRNANRQQESRRRWRSYAGLIARVPRA